jgi:hypothetical protein
VAHTAGRYADPNLVMARSIGFDVFADLELLVQSFEKRRSHPIPPFGSGVR